MLDGIQSGFKNPSQTNNNMFPNSSDSRQHYRAESKRSNAYITP